MNDPIIINRDPAPGEAFTPCHYSAIHMMRGVPATGIVQFDALGRAYPDGKVPACDACQKFVNNNA